MLNDLSFEHDLIMVMRCNVGIFRINNKRSIKQENNNNKKTPTRAHRELKRGNSNSQPEIPHEHNFLIRLENIKGFNASRILAFDFFLYIN
jgi:hypothetical protein